MILHFGIIGLVVHIFIIFWSNSLNLFSKSLVPQSNIKKVHTKQIWFYLTLKNMKTHNIFGKI